VNRVTLGILLIVVGAVALSAYFFGTPLALAVYWPVLLVLYGIRLLQSDRTAYAVGMMAVGIVLLADNLLPLPPLGRVSDFWPVLVIVLGIFMILGIVQSEHAHPEPVAATGSRGEPGGAFEAEGRIITAEVSDEGVRCCVTAATAGAPSSEAAHLADEGEEAPPAGADAEEHSYETEKEDMTGDRDDSTAGEAAQATVDATYENGRGHFLVDLPEGVEAIEYEFHVSAGTMKIIGTTDKLIEIGTKQGSCEPRFDLTLSEREGKQVAHLRIVPEHTSSRLAIFAGTVWELKLNRNLPLLLDLEANAAKCELDLAELMINTLHLENNAAHTKIQLGERVQEIKMQCENNAAKLELQAPSRFAFDAEVVNHLGNHNLTSFGVRRDEDRYISQGYETSEFKLGLQVTNNVANFELKLI